MRWSAWYDSRPLLNRTFRLCRNTHRAVHHNSGYTWECQARVARGRRTWKGKRSRWLTFSLWVGLTRNIFTVCESKLEMTAAIASRSRKTSPNAAPKRLWLWTSNRMPCIVICGFCSIFVLLKIILNSYSLYLVVCQKMARIANDHQNNKSSRSRKSQKSTICSCSTSSTPIVFTDRTVHPYRCSPSFLCWCGQWLHKFPA